MGDLVIVFKIMPESADVDLGAIQSQVKDVVKSPAELQQMEESPIAFGLKALKVTITTDDEGGGQDAIEEALSGIEGVGSVSVEDIGRF